MKHGKIVLGIMLLSIFLLMSSAIILHAEDTAEDTKQIALESAGTFLNLVDEGKYLKSWIEAAQYFQTAVSKEEWQKSLTAIRTPLGKIVRRRLLSAQYTTSLPGAPDGEYVVIQYETSFENKEKSIETVTPMLDKDGVWRVSGYYIK